MKNPGSRSDHTYCVFLLDTDILRHTTPFGSPRHLTSETGTGPSLSMTSIFSVFLGVCPQVPQYIIHRFHSLFCSRRFSFFTSPVPPDPSLVSLPEPRPLTHDSHPLCRRTFPRTSVHVSHRLRTSHTSTRLFPSRPETFRRPQRPTDLTGLRA